MKTPGQKNTGGVTLAPEAHQMIAAARACMADFSRPGRQAVSDLEYVRLIAEQAGDPGAIDRNDRIWMAAWLAWLISSPAPPAGRHDRTMAPGELAAIDPPVFARPAAEALAAIAAPDDGAAASLLAWAEAVAIQLRRAGAADAGGGA